MNDIIKILFNLSSRKTSIIYKLPQSSSDA